MTTSNQLSTDNDVDLEYFNSYDDITVHELMLKDEPRVQAYKNFIENNTEIFCDKIVIDIGSGSGILSLLTARAGAKHVFAIEAATNISNLSRKVIEDNGFQDRITVINSSVEDCRLPEGELADVLVSEWMGFYLFHESMLSAVITARDRLLKPDGLIFPSTATLYACPVALKEFVRQRVDFWKNICGFDFSAVSSAVQAASLAKPEIIVVSQQSLIAKRQQVIGVDMKFVDMEDVNNIRATIDFVIERNDVMHGFALWFDVAFEGSQSVVLSTSPSSAATHWKQTIALLPSALLVNRTSQLSCRLQLQRQQRRYDINIELLDEMSTDDDDDEEEHQNGCEIEAGENEMNCSSVELQDIISQKMKPVT